MRAREDLAQRHRDGEQDEKKGRERKALVMRGDGVLPHHPATTCPRVLARFPSIPPSSHLALSLCVSVLNLFPRSRHIAALALLLIPALFAAGCMTRTGIITSEPSGARVVVNEVDIGITPCEFDFAYYGTYDALLTLPGYEPARVPLRFRQPWYEFPPLDLPASALPALRAADGTPGRPGVHTVRREHIVLVPTPPATPASEAQLLDRARELRERAIRQPSTPAR